MEIIIYLLVGAFAGFLAGLFGVGGGAIIVPILIFLFGLQGFDPGILVHMALGTSFATIVFTSLSSVAAHHKLRNIDWTVVWRMFPGLVLGVVLCSILATQLQGGLLQFAIAIFLCSVSLQMFFELRPKATFDLPGKVGLFAAGSAIGGASAFFGIAGGSMTVPFLSACGLVMRKAVAISAACGLPVAVFGALVYGWQGSVGEGELPAYASGYIYWPAFLGIVIASTPMAKIGAKMASELSENVMRRSFAVVLFAVGVRLLTAT